MSRVDAPYRHFPEVSKTFVNEISFRMRSACRAIEILADYKDKRPKTEVEHEQIKSIRYIMARFAILELCAAFDRNGQWSLRLDKNKRGKFSAPSHRLRKVFPKMAAAELSALQSKLNKIVSRNSSLIARLLHTRHNRIAHAGSPSSKFDPRSLSSVRFPKTRCFRLASQIEAVMLETSFGISLDWDHS